MSSGPGRSVGEAPVVVAQQEIQGHWLGKLRRRPDAAVLVVEGGCQGAVGVVQHVVGQDSGGLGQLAGAPHLFPKLLGDPLNLAGVGAVGFRNRQQQPGEAGHVGAVDRREVGAAVEGLSLGSEENRHRPAAAAGEHLHGLHVYRVQVRPLLPVNLDADEILVHQRRNRLILKGLPFHHVAPVAGGIADAQQDGLVLRPGQFQRLRPPRDASPPGCGRAAKGKDSSRLSTGWACLLPSPLAGFGTDGGD